MSPMVAVTNVRIFNFQLKNSKVKIRVKVRLRRSRPMAAQ